MTQKIKAEKGSITKEMEIVAREEEVPVEWVREKIAIGRIAIPANKNHQGVKPTGIGEGLRIKVNTNIGTSSDHIDLEEELRKLEGLDSGGDRYRNGFEHRWRYRHDPKGDSWSLFHSCWDRSDL